MASIWSANLSVASRHERLVIYLVVILVFLDIVANQLMASCLLYASLLAGPSTAAADTVIVVAATLA